MRLGILTQWYEPEPGPAGLPGVLARKLVARGHEVHVLTGFPNYPVGRIADGYKMRPRMREDLGGVSVHRVALIPGHSASATMRIANYASFGAIAAMLGTGALRGLDAVWVNYSPITVAWPMWVVQRRFGTPLVVHVLDLWPDTLSASGFAGAGRIQGVADRALSAWCNAIYRRAHSVAYISPGVGPLLERRGVPREKLHYAPMWADETVFRPSELSMRPELGIDDAAIVVLYAGALGEAQGLSTLVAACAMVEDPRLVCIVAGSGVAECSLREQAERVGAGSVRFIGRVPQMRMTELMASADATFIGLRPHALSSITMPSKIQAGLAAGKPLVISAGGDAAAVGLASGAAFVAAPGDAYALARILEEVCETGRDGLRAMGRGARTYYERTFGVAQGVGRIERMLMQAASARRPA